MFVIRFYKDTAPNGAKNLSGTNFVPKEHRKLASHEVAGESAHSFPSQRDGGNQ